MSDKQHSNAIISSVQALLCGKKQIATKIVSFDRFSPQSIKENYYSMLLRLSLPLQQVYLCRRQEILHFELYFQNHLPQEIPQLLEELSLGK